jgi:hypothetical protein
MGNGVGALICCSPELPLAVIANCGPVPAPALTSSLNIRGCRRRAKLEDSLPGNKVGRIDPRRDREVVQAVQAGNRRGGKRRGQVHILIVAVQRHSIAELACDSVAVCSGCSDRPRRPQGRHNGVADRGRNGTHLRRLGAIAQQAVLRRCSLGAGVPQRRVGAVLWSGGTLAIVVERRGIRVVTWQRARRILDQAVAVGVVLG